MGRSNDNNCCNLRSKESYWILSLLQAVWDDVRSRLKEASLPQGLCEFGISSHFSFDLWWILFMYWTFSAVLYSSIWYVKFYRYQKSIPICRCLLVFWFWFFFIILIHLFLCLQLACLYLEWLEHTACNLCCLAQAFSHWMLSQQIFHFCFYNPAFSK